MLWGGGVFYATLRAYKFLWLRGRTGGGKTALAYNLALTLLYDGYVDEIYSNVPGVSRIPGPGDIPERACVLIDEGGMFMKKTADFEATCAALRKLQDVVIIASVIPPAREFAALSVQRTLNLARLCGWNAWVYEWRLSYDYVTEKGSFIWTNPGAVFGLYDTAAFPVDDAGIGDWMDGYIKEHKGRSFSRFATSRTITGDRSARASSLAQIASAARAAREHASAETHAGAGATDAATNRLVSALDDTGDGMGQAAGAIESAAQRIESAAQRIASSRRRRP